jgi:hypothetical protein
MRAVGAQVTQGDAERASLADVTHVYLAWTCFSAATRERIVERLRDLPAGARVVVLNNEIASGDFAQVARAHPLCSWGRTPAFVYERVE